MKRKKQSKQAAPIGWAEWWHSLKFRDAISPCRFALAFWHTPLKALLSRLTLICWMPWLVWFISADSSTETNIPHTNCILKAKHYQELRNAGCVCINPLCLDLYDWSQSPLQSNFLFHTSALLVYCNKKGAKQGESPRNTPVFYLWINSEWE